MPKKHQLLYLALIYSCAPSDSKLDLHNEKVGLSHNIASKSGNIPSSTLVFDDVSKLFSNNIEGESHPSPVVQAKEVIFFLGKFTGKNQEECIVLLKQSISCPRVPCDALMLYHKLNGRWTYSGWCASRYGIDLNVFDFNKDGISELKINYSVIGSGIYGKGIEILSLNSHDEKVLYSNEGLDFSEARDLDSWIKGDTVFINFDVSFNEAHNELMETKKIGLFKSILGDSILSTQVSQSRKFFFE